MYGTAVLVISNVYFSVKVGVPETVVFYVDVYMKLLWYTVVKVKFTFKNEVSIQGLPVVFRVMILDGSVHNVLCCFYFWSIAIHDY